MLNIARQNIPSVEFDLVNDIETANQFYQESSFDLIICRQVVGHLTDPISTFRLWLEWLKPSGHIAIIDGLWSREDWSDEWHKYLDYFPLSCIQSWATLSYMMEQAGMAIVKKNWLDRVNHFEADRVAGTEGLPVVRYIVVGQLKDENQDSTIT